MKDWTVLWTERMEHDAYENTYSNHYLGELEARQSYEWLVKKPNTTLHNRYLINGRVIEST